MLTSTLEGKLRSGARANYLDDFGRVDCIEFASVLQEVCEPAGHCLVLLREHERQGRESFRDVLADGLSDLSFAADVVEHVVGDLEREAEEAAVFMEGLALRDR